jgi:hypothetical protein
VNRRRLSLCIALCVLAACHYDALNLNNRACPCLAGYTCESTTNTCVPLVVLDFSGEIDDFAGVDLAGVDLTVGCDTTQCTSTANGVPMCSAFGCKWTCDTGFAHCMSGNTGCETATTSNVKHCGSCGNDCTDGADHVVGLTCTNSKCAYTSCSPGYVDCNGSTNDGCESNPQTDIRHCGSCTTNCQVNVKNVVNQTCNTGNCDYDACQPFFADCNGLHSDGCECACGAATQNCCPAGAACKTGLTCSAGKCN